LKALLPESTGSVYVLEKELKEKLRKQNVNYSTLLRHINKLVNEGSISRTIVDRVLAMPHFKKLEIAKYILILTKGRC
jgi:hypothetical protein